MPQLRTEYQTVCGASDGTSQQLSQLPLYWCSLNRYLQQYGKERTGTNVLKALLATNFVDFVLFDNRLGSKHEAFRDVRTWMEERGIRRRSDFDELLVTDKYWRLRNIPSEDLFEGVHKPVTYEELRGLRDGTLPLAYLISIKDPYAYAVSINRWVRHGVSQFQDPPNTIVPDADLTRRKCLAFNSAYASYWPLIESGKGMLVRYEELLEDAIGVMSRVQETFGLTARTEALVNVSTTVAPTVGISSASFYSSFYRDREYLTVLDSGSLKAVTETIDWELMRRFGYFPVEDVSPMGVSVEGMSEVSFKMTL